MLDFQPAETETKKLLIAAQGHDIKITTMVSVAISALRAARYCEAGDGGGYARERALIKAFADDPAVRA